VRAFQLLEGSWYDSDNGTKRRHVTQYHEVMDYFVGRWLRIIVQVIVLVVLLGAGGSHSSLLPNKPADWRPVSVSSCSVTEV
jgi:hypothetical protein